MTETGPVPGGLPSGILALGSVPPPAPDAIGRARLALAQRMDGEKEGTDPGVRQRAAHTALRAAGTGDRTRSTQHPHRGRRIAMAAAVAVLVAGSGTYLGVRLLAGQDEDRHQDQHLVTPATPTPSPSTSAPATSGPPAVVLSGTPEHQLTQVLTSIRSQPDDWKASPYWYTQRIDPSFGADEASLSETWVGHDRTWSLSRLASAARQPGEKPSPRGESQFSVGSRGPDIGWDGVWDVTTDPTELAQLIRQQNHSSDVDPDTDLFVSAIDPFYETPLPPQLRASLLEMAASVRGATLVGSATDLLGRPSFAIDFADPSDTTATAITTRFYFDPVTGMLNQTEDLGMIPFDMVIVAQGPVASFDDTPPLPDGLAGRIAKINAAEDTGTPPAVR